MCKAGAKRAVDDFNSFSAEQRTRWVDPYYMLLQEVLYGATLEARPDDERVRIIYTSRTNSGENLKGFTGSSSAITLGWTR